MRDILLAAVLMALLPLSFRKPFVGLLIFSALAYMRLQDLTWGFARYVRWSFYYAIVTFAGFFVNEPERKFMANDVRNLIMMIMVAFVGIGMVVNGYTHKWDIANYSEYGKVVLIALFTTGMITTRDRLRIIIWVIALSFAFFGFKSGVVGIMTAGGTQINEGPGGMLADNNDFALALAMGIPMLWNIAKSERSPALRRILFAGVPMTMITIMMTHSRGGFLAMSTAIMMLVWRSRNRVSGIATVCLIGIAGVLFSPQSYQERLTTIRHFEEEGSAMARLAAWRTASIMAINNPLLGVGFGHFEDHYYDYDPSVRDATLHHAGSAVAHNSYLQIWAECGTPTFVLYLTLILLSFLDVWSVRALAKRRYHSSWILNYCTMFEASLATFLVGSTFLNRAHFDLFYHWVALVICFGRIARSEMADEQRYPVKAGRRNVLVPVPKPGFGRRRVAGGFLPRPAFGRQSG